MQKQYVIIYTYEGDTPVESNEYNLENELAKTNVFTFDNKNNPNIGFGIMLNSFEMIFGYVIGNYEHNLVKIETTYHLPSKWESKEAGDEETRIFEYEYNEYGYPVKQPGDNEVTYTYTCA